jgi:glycerol-3-phosphate dehydrogenase (NAD(P)+)
MKISVLGAGAWGTALAIRAAHEHAVCLWARNSELAQQMQTERLNQRYLSAVSLPSALQITDQWPQALGHAQGGLIVIATPIVGLRDLLNRLPATSSGVIWLCKGFEDGTALLAHEIAQQLRPDLRVGVLSGPSFALEVAHGQPTALVIASRYPQLCAEVVQCFHNDALRIYTSTDVVGVEVGGAVKNVLAIATGIADGLNLGLNARAALITRGLAEMTRLGLALGAQPETFMGLSGLGDLVLTATGDLSRNRKVGLMLARGQDLSAILNDLGHVAEGVKTAQMVWQRAQALRIEMPITHAVVRVLSGELQPRQALEFLMGRAAKSEQAMRPQR